MLKRKPYKKIDYITSQCPVCNASEALVNQVFSYKDAAYHLGYKEEENNFFALTAKVKELWNSETCYFVTCINCSFSYASPNISGDSYFYNMAYTNDKVYFTWNWGFQITYNVIKSITEQNSGNCLKLLEIGAGNGSFVKRVALNLIKKENILTTEFSSYGFKEISNFGIKCIQFDIWDKSFNEYKNSFSIVCMFQILEHLNDYDKLFDGLSWLTKKNANLFITVPNNIHRIIFEKLGFIEDVPPVHIGRWNRKSFDFIAKKYGWAVVSNKIEPNKPLKNIQKFLSFKYGSARITKNIYNIKIVFVRRMSLILIIPFLIMINIKTIISLFNKTYGVLQWVHLKKIT